MKRTWFIVLFVVLFVPSLIYSGGQAEPTKAAEQKVVEMKFWGWYGEDRVPVIDELLSKFTALNPNTKVIYEFIPFGDYKKQLSIALSANTLPDIVMVDNPDHAAFSKMGFFADITKRVQGWKDKDKLFEGPLRSAMWENKYYGLPTNSNCLGLFYNKDMLGEAGVAVPETWDQLKEAARVLTKGGRYGLGIASPKNEAGTFQFLPFLLSAGGSVEKLDSPEVLKALKLWVGFIQDGSVSKEVINWSQDDVAKQFYTKQVAMMVNGPWTVPGIRKEAPDLKWFVANVPKDKKYASSLGGSNMGIGKGKDTDYAWEFLKFYVDPERQNDYFFKMGMFSSRSDAPTTLWEKDPVMVEFIRMLQYAMPRGPHPRWPEISTAIQVALQKALTLTVTPEEALREARQTVDKLLKE